MSGMQPADLDAKQLWFLILHFLSDSPVSHMLKPLERQLIQSRLLPGPANDDGTETLHMAVFRCVHVFKA